MDIGEALDTLRTSRFGIDCYLSEREPYSCAIKQNANGSDFVVCEESLTCDKASVDCQALPKRPAEQATDSLHQPSKKRTYRNLKKPEPVQPWESGDGHICWTILCSLLPAQCLEGIHKLADHVVQNPAISTAEEVTISLGDITAAHRLVSPSAAQESTGPEGNRQLRAIVHRCVRSTFPQLATIADRASNTLTARADPCFYTLYSACRDINDALRLLWFNHVKRLQLGESHADSLALCAVGRQLDRVQRGQVHHTVRQQFGKTLESKTRSRADLTPDHLKQNFVAPCQYDTLVQGLGKLQGNSPSVQDDSMEPSLTTGHGPAYNTSCHDVASSNGACDQFIEVRFRPMSSSVQQRRKLRANDSAQDKDNCRPLYLHFAMEKRKLETLTAMRMLANLLDVRLCDFAFAGTKDCHAVTTQYVSVKGVDATELVALKDRLAATGIHTGLYSYHSLPLSLGQLRGNHFNIVAHRPMAVAATGSASHNHVQQECDNSVSDIIRCHVTGHGGVDDVTRQECLATHNPLSSEAPGLRTCTGVSPEILRRVQQASELGFINYFGPQRFGASYLGVPSQNIGLAMLLGDMELAVKLFMTPGPGIGQSSDVVPATCAESTPTPIEAGTCTTGMPTVGHDSTPSCQDGIGAPHRVLPSTAQDGTCPASDTPVASALTSSAQHSTTSVHGDLLKGSSADGSDSWTSSSGVTNSKAPNRPSERAKVDAAKAHFLATGDAKRALQLMPKRSTRECLLLAALVRFTDSKERYRNALMALPHETRTFYVHAYASRLWNACASHRLECWPRHVVPGDMVLVSESNARTDGVASHTTAQSAVATPSPGASLHCDDVATQKNDVSQTDVLVRDDDSSVCLPIGNVDDMPLPSAPQPALVSASVACSVPTYRILTLSDLSAGHNYRLSDVVVPMLGSRGLSEESNLYTFVMAYLEADGIELNAFNVTPLGMRVKGAMRRLISRPEQLRCTCACACAHSPNQGAGDVDSKEASSSAHPATDTAQSAYTYQSAAGGVSISECAAQPTLPADEQHVRCGKQSDSSAIPSGRRHHSSRACRDVRLEFFLPPSTYATSLLHQLFGNAAQYSGH